MHSVFFLLSSRYLRRRKLRTLLLIASIALGVATLVATRTLNQSLGKAAQGAITPWSSATDIIVLNGQVGLPASIVEKIKAAAIPGLLEIQPLVIGRAVVPELANRSVLLLGIDPSAASVGEASRWGISVAWTESASTLLSLALTGKKPALVGRGIAEALATKSDFSIRAAGVVRQARVVGIVQVEGAAAPLGSGVVYMRANDAGELVYPTRPDHVSQISIATRSGEEVEKIRRQVQEIVGELGDVRTAEANDQSVRDVTAGLELGFAIGGMGALVVGLFLVYNALSVSVAERRHDIGILRSLGATRGQVAGLFVAEAAGLGLLGAVLGVPLGLGLARLGLGPIGRLLSDLFVQMDSGGVKASPRTIVLAIFAGVATSLLAALVPALQASWEEPADAVRRVPRLGRGLLRLLQVGTVVLLLAAGTGFVAGRESLPTRIGAFGGIVCLLLAALVATPILAALLGRAVQPLFRVIFGLEGRLAADNLTRSPGRTGLVIGALAATVGLVVQTAGFIRSTEVAVFSWLDDQVAADLFVTSGSLASTASLALPMDESYQAKLSAVPGVAAAMPARFHRLDFRDRIVVLIAVDPLAFANTDKDHALARNMGRFDPLRHSGAALVSENFAALYKVKKGDRITFRGKHGPVEVEVIGTVVDYTWNRGTVIVDRRWFAKEFDDHQVDIFDVFLKPEADPAQVRQAITEELGKEDALFVLSREELRRDVSGVLKRIYGMAYAQQAVVGLVALLGVVGALLISVLQRQRELGLLRAIGATQAQVLRSVLAEAVLMGLIGAVIGVGVGFLLEWYTVAIMLPDEAGFTFPMIIPWMTAGIVIALATLLATLAGIGPAIHAMRLPIATAIAYE